MLETLIGVGILVAVLLAAKHVFLRNDSQSGPVVGGGTIDEGSTGNGDGSVTPPKSGTDVA